MTTKTQQIKFKDADRMYWTVVVSSEPINDDSGLLDTTFTYYRSHSGYFGESDDLVKIAELSYTISDTLISVHNVWAALAQYFILTACAASADAKIINLEP